MSYLFHVSYNPGISGTRLCAVVLVDAKLEPEIVDVVGQGLDTAGEPVLVGLQHAHGAPATEQFLERKVVVLVVVTFPLPTSSRPL